MYVNCGKTRNPTNIVLYMVTAIYTKEILIKHTIYLSSLAQKTFLGRGGVWYNSQFELSLKSVKETLLFPPPSKQIKSYTNNSMKCCYNVYKYSSKKEICVLNKHILLNWLSIHRKQIRVTMQIEREVISIQNVTAIFLSIIW